jgi:DNA polymerase-3 subunit chi
MAEIRLYHLLTQPLERALPAILGKILSTDRRAYVRFPDIKQAKYFNDQLWTYSPDSFLPHGLSDGSHADKQPVLIGIQSENPNKAEVLVLCNQQEVPDNIAEFTLCCDFFDGQNDDAVSDARSRWKAYKDGGHTVSYWQQTESGSWEQKA